MQELVTDHEPLTSIFHPKKGIPAMTVAPLQRHALFLAGFNYSIEYKNTTQHGNADGLSRLPVTRDSGRWTVDGGPRRGFPNVSDRHASNQCEYDPPGNLKGSCFIACVRTHKARVANKV